MATRKRNKLKALKAAKQYKYIISSTKNHTTHNIYNQIISKTKQKCLSQFGFIGNPKLPPWENAQLQIGKTTQKEYFNKIKNIKYHDLCQSTKLPKTLGSILGLGLKFCIQSSTPEQQMDMERFYSDVRKRFIFAGDISDKEECPKPLLIKSKWVPEAQDSELEDKLDQFHSTINSLNNKHLSHIKKSSNLSNLQKSHLNNLRQNDNIVTLMCDKNLGPAVIERQEYINMVLKEHLLDSSTYTQLKEEEAQELLSKMRENTCEEYAQQASDLLDYEKDYFRSFVLKLPERLRIPQFYGMPKVHKNKQPTPLRPVVAQCGSFTAFISTWIDTKLQPLKHRLPSYIKNSQDLLNIIDKLPPLPHNARIVTTDATSMYTNISTEEGIDTIRKYLLAFAHEIRETMPIDLICNLLETVMTQNIFKFGNTWWKQKNGTAMGTPCACIYATLFFGYHERKLLLTKYKENLILYKRQIDDIFIIWRPTSPDNHEWTNFVNDLNSCSSLNWETEELGTKTNFLDLTLWIDPETRQIKYKTYQKPMCLFLYIPGHSAHSPNTIKSMIYSLLKTYKRQNPNPTDFTNISKLLFKRLVVRGHSYQTLKTIFKDSLRKIKTTPQNTSKKRKLQQQQITKDDPYQSSRVFFHLKYHPRGLPRRQIQQTYMNCCTTNNPDNETGFDNMVNPDTDGKMKIKQFTIAYSRPKNIRDLLCPSTLYETDDISVQHSIKRLKK